MEFEKIIDKMEDILDSAWRLPMSGGRSVVDASEIEKLIQDLRLALPSEISEANRIIENKNQIIKTAKNNCEEIYRVARNKVESMVDDHEIVKLAKEREMEIARDLKERSDKMIKNSKEIIEKSLTELETVILSSMEQIKNVKKCLKNFK